MHTIHRSYRLTTSMNTSVLFFFVGGYLSTFAVACVSPGGWCRTSGGGPAAPPPAGHDIAGQGLHMDLPIAQVRRTAVFRSGDVAQDRSPIEEQAAAGQWPGPGRLRCNEP